MHENGGDERILNVFVFRFSRSDRTTKQPKLKIDEFLISKSNVYISDVPLLFVLLPLKEIFKVIESILDEI